MPPEISEPDFNIPLAWEPEKYDQKPAIENNHTDIACAKIGWQEAKNLNLFTQKLGNHFNMFLNMLRNNKTTKDKPIPVTVAETTKPSWNPGN